jgi:hypothetical protein
MLYQARLIHGGLYLNSASKINGNDSEKYAMVNVFILKFRLHITSLANRENGSLHKKQKIQVSQ